MKHKPIIWSFSQLPNRLFTIILLLAAWQTNFGQLQGFISDIGTNQSINNVTITFKNSTHITSSKTNGTFTIPESIINWKDTSLLEGKLNVFGNTLGWNFNDNIKLTLFHQDGRILFTNKTKVESGNISLSGFPKGIHIVKVNTSKGNREYRLLNLGNTYKIGKLSNKEYTPIIYHSGDSVYFSHDDYFPFSVALDDVLNKDGELHIQLLKKKYSNLSYFKYLLSKDAFHIISNRPSKSHLGSIQSAKVLININTHTTFFINTKKYLSHYNFSTAEINYKGSHRDFNRSQYNNVPQRYLYPITLNYFPDRNFYTFEFFPGDGATCKDIKFCYDEILKYSYIDSTKLFFFATNTSWDKCGSVPIKTTNDIYQELNYQALNISENYGYLKKVNIDDVKEYSFTRRDILLTNGIPVALPVVAGVITSEFQTPLSHVNVLSYNRGTPNMALRTAYTDADIKDLENKLVHFKVEADTFFLRSATIEEAESFWRKNEPSETVNLSVDLSDSTMVNLSNENSLSISKIGGKAANFAEMLQAYKNASITAPVPENHFAIPFFYYMEHIQRAGIENYIKSVISDDLFKVNIAYRRNQLANIQGKIIEQSINPTLLTLVKNKIGEDKRFASYRFRSSTNAEDVEGFNGAGLYYSFSADVNNDSQIEEAIKKVWASFWNYTAFEEREYFKINHLSCAMGILVHRSFPNENANGVAITYNPYNTNHAYLINVQHGESSIVFPEEGVLNDQFVLYTFSITGQGRYTIEYISRSNVYGTNTPIVLSQQEAIQLGDYLTILKQHYFKLADAKDYTKFALDIEFKLDSQVSPKKLYLKQCRRY